MPTPTKYSFLSITQIEKVPAIDLHNEVEVTGEARITDSVGRLTTVCFYDFTASGSGIGGGPLAVKNGDDFTTADYDLHEDGEAYISRDRILFLDDYERAERDIARAIDEIEQAATLAAETVWTQVWVEAATKAEAL